MKNILFILLISVGVFAMSFSMQELSDEDKMLYGFVAREVKKKCEKQELQAKDGYL